MLCGLSNNPPTSYYFSITYIIFVPSITYVRVGTLRNLLNLNITHFILRKRCISLFANSIYERNGAENHNFCFYVTFYLCHNYSALPNLSVMHLIYCNNILTKIKILFNKQTSKPKITERKIRIVYIF